jgi:iron complex outermembrane receptor protein
MNNLLMILCTTTLVFSQERNINISGEIYSQHGKPIEGVDIHLTAEENRHTTSDLYGKYAFPNVQSKHIKISFNKNGFHRLEKEIRIDHKAKQHIHVTLKDSIPVKYVLDEVEVYGHEWLENDKVLSSNKIQARSMDIPNSSGLVSNNLIEEQQLLTLGEGISAVSGVYQYNKGHGGSSETFGARGLSLRYLGFMFRDGIRFGTNQSLATPEIQAYERVEVLKGSAAIHYGYISPGATINFITKKPLINDQIQLSFRAGSYDFYQPSLDLNYQLSKNAAVRLISSAQRAKSFRESVETRRYYTYGAYRYIFSTHHVLDVNMEFLDDVRPRDFGLPIFENMIVVAYDEKNARQTPVYLQTEGRERLYGGIDKSLRHRFLGSSFNERKSTQWNGQIRHHKQLHENWALTTSIGASISGYDYEQTGSGFRNIYIQENDDLKIIRSFEKANWNENTWGAQLHVVGDARWFGINNRISISSDFDLRIQDSEGYPYQPNFDYIYLYNREVEERESIAIDPYLKAKRQFRGYGLSVQNLLKLSPKINFLAALRLDIVDGYSRNTYLIDGKDLMGKIRGRATFAKGQIDLTEHRAEAVTPNVGVTYKLTENNTIFTSFTNAFNPNSRARLDVDENVLPPYRTNQFEIGTKNIFQNKMQFNLTLFKIDDHSYLSDPTVEDRYMIGTGTQYKGIESDLFFNDDNLDFNINYTYIDARYNDNGSRVGGSRPQQTPEHQAGFRIAYQFSTDGFWKRVSLNLNGQYTSERLGNDHFKRNAMAPYIQKAYTLLNIGARYQANQFSVNVRGTNILDEFVFMSYRTGSVNPIDPFQLSITTTYTF